MNKMVCVVPECERPQHGRGVCRPHYMKCWREKMEWPAFAPAPAPTRAERFWAKVARGSESECWEWTASRLPNGYGQFDHTTAHRVAIELTRGVELSADVVVDHRCRNTWCVNPDHLEPTSQAVNVDRGYAGPVASTTRREWSARRTHCKNGHPLTPENEYNPPGRPTWRVCRACKSERQRARVS